MSAHDGGPASKSLTLRPASNPCISASTGPTPLGTLSCLPRELRDEIYRHVGGTKYYLSSPFKPYYQWHTGDTGDRDIVSPIVTLSKSIRQEFLAILYAETLFVIRDTTDFCSGTWRRNGIPWIDQIQNMMYVRSLFLYNDEDYNDYGYVPSEWARNITQKYAEPVSFFAGTEVLRKSCVVELYDLTPKAILLLESPFINALENLTGFKTVVVKLTTSSGMWCPEDAVKYIEGGPSCRDQAAGFWIIVDEIKYRLELSLGPSVISEANGEHSTLGWELAFHPQDFLAKKNVKTN